MPSVTLKDANNATQTLTTPGFDAALNVKVNIAPLADTIDTINVTKINGVNPQIDNTDILAASVWYANQTGAGKEQPQVQANVTLWASAAKTATWSSAVQSNPSARGLTLAINVTVAGTSTLIPSVRGSFPGSLSPVLHPAITALTTTGLYLYKLYPYTTVPTNGAFTALFDLNLPHDWIFKMTHGDASSWTYGVYVALHS